MNELPKIVRARLQAQPAEVHPDADVLTAFYEQVLPEKERGPVLAHLAECSECRDVVGMALPPVEERVPVARPESAWGWPQMVRWGSVVACVVVVGAAVMIRHSGTPEVARPRTEEAVMQQQEELTDAGKDKAPVAEPASAQQKLRVENEQKKAPLVLSEKSVPAQPVPAQPKRIEPSPAAGNTSVGDQAPKQSLDHSASAGIVGGALGRARQSGNVVSSAVPAPAPAMKVEAARIADDQAVNTGAASAADQKPAEIPGRAKAGAPAAANEVVEAEQDSMSPAPSLAKENRAGLTGAPANPGSVPAQFVLSPEGQLQRSFDSGKSWEPVPVVERAKFNALAVMGPEVWVGGAAGVLYHSADNGLQWKLVKPSIAGVALTSDVMNVRFTDMQHLAVITSDGQVWTTSDGGQNWQRNR